MTNKIKLQNDIKKIFLLLFLLSIILKYIHISIVLSVILLIIMYLFLISKNDLFYLALVFLMVQEPLGIPYKHFAIHFAQFSIDIRHVFYIVSFIKWYNLKNRYNFIYKGYFKFKELLLLFIFILLVSFLYSTEYGMRGAALFIILRSTVSVLIFFSIPLFFKDKRSINSFFLMVSPIVFINFLGQLVAFVVKKEVIASFFGANLYDMDYSNMPIVRSIYSIYIIYFVIIYSLYYLLKERSIGGKLKKYLYSLISISYLSIFLSGTRGWSLAIIIIFLGWLLAIGIRKATAMIFIFGIIIFALIVSPLSDQLHKSLERLNTSFEVIENYKQGYNTHETRIEKRLPKMLKGFKKSPIVGLGINNAGYEYIDGHVGLAMNLARFGVIGFILLTIFWLKFLYIQIKNSKAQKANIMFFWGMIGLLIIHSIVASVFNFIRPDVDIFLPVFLLYSYACNYNNNVEMEKKLNDKLIESRK